ncbi:MAG: class I SAM-dependent methyltransferase [Spirochaetaceae bacterium]|nr:MAG: class I SAM-dependent methyltransferase [Spirochaetaceae bacterium]
MATRFWDERFSTEEYIYGEDPNDFIRERISLHEGPGDPRVLDLACGEGRNSVFLAKLGYAVTALDFSAVGIEKTRALAQKNGIPVYSLITNGSDAPTESNGCADLDSEFDRDLDRKPEDQKPGSINLVCTDALRWSPSFQYPLVVATFFHLWSEHKPKLFDLYRHLLKPGGRMVTEWFHTRQRIHGYTSGGPREAEMLVTAEELRSAFSDFEIIVCEELERELFEGPKHCGPAYVVRFEARKPK